MPARDRRSGYPSFLSSPNALLAWLGVARVREASSLSGILRSFPRKMPSAIADSNSEWGLKAD
jgi:hypothetical protein